MQHLVFQLAGPLASWGGTTGGTARSTLNYPTRSAILGYLGACLGIERADSARQAELVEEFRVAVRRDREGSFLVDYHTVETPERDSRVRWRTRAHELERSRATHTLVSQREYWSDVEYTVAVWAERAEVARLGSLREAMLQPRFAPWLGRKSCPLSLPAFPQIVDAATLHEAFAKYDGTRPRLRLAGTTRGAIQHDPHPASGLRHVRTQRIRDVPSSRTKWLFTVRDAFESIPEGESIVPE